MTDFLEAVMEKAFENAQKAGKDGEIPVCAAVFDPLRREIVSVAVNRTENDSDPTAHAEILAIREACKKRKAPRLPDCDMYVTLEPCPMCAAAVSFARIRRLYFGAYSPKTGAVEHGCRLYDSPTRLYVPEVYGGFGEKRAEQLLKTFFETLRMP